MSELMVPVSIVAFVLVSWSVIIALINFTLWFYLLKKRLPEAEDRYMKIIEEKEAKYIKKLDDLVEGKDNFFNKIVVRIKEVLPNIDKTFEEQMPKIANGIIEQFTKPPTEEMIAALKNINQFGYNYIMSDPDIQKSLTGWINGKMNGVISQIENRVGFKEEDIKDLRELIAFFNANKEKFAKYANMAPGGEGGGTGIPFLDNMMGGGQGFPM